ncbi:hypothetical protein PINS_up000290 [Pythium insidiosum]|nr:hypothetical protein PINS_up000290 [Pythium insidiosum]
MFCGPEDPSETAFVPRSIVLTRGRVAFDSDDDDNDNKTRPTTSLERTIRPVDDATKWSKLVYSDDGYLKSVKFDTHLVPRSLVGLLPTDAWDTLLNDEDRRRLAVLLPPMDETQQSQVVRALLSGENFCFGTPLMALDEMIRSGQCTEEAMCDLVKRTKLGLEASRRCYRERIRQQLKTLWENHKKRAREHQDLQDDKNAVQDRCQHNEKQAHVLTSPHQTGSNSTSAPTSVFQAIRHVLETDSSSEEEIVDRLQADYRFLFSGIPSNVTFRQSGHQANFSGCQARNNIERENDYLVVMEAFFNSVMADKRSSRTGIAVENENENEPTENSLESQPKWKKMRVTGSETIRAHKQVTIKSRDFALTAKSPPYHPSRILKKSLCPVHPRSKLVDGIDEYHRLETRRYKHHTQSFLYPHPSCDDGVTVGPTLKESEEQVDSAQLLVPDAPGAVTMLSLVYDACARLPEGVGTRADIGILVSASRFVRTDALMSLLNKAITHRLSILEVMPLGEFANPCVRFDAHRGVWEYQHALNAWSVTEPEIEAPTHDTPKKLSIQNLLH